MIMNMMSHYDANFGDFVVVVVVVVVVNFDINM